MGVHALCGSFFSAQRMNAFVLFHYTRADPLCKAFFPRFPTFCEIHSNRPLHLRRAFMKNPG